MQSVGYKGRSDGIRDNLIVIAINHGAVSLVAQTIKIPPAVHATWVRSRGQEDPLEKGMATHSSTLAWRIPTDRGAWWAPVHGAAESQTQLSD